MKAKCAALLIGLLVSMVTGPVKANTFSYSFTNTALLPGTDIVKGTITLNAADTAATSLTVDSNTGGFGLGQYIGSPSHNSFTVVSGNIATADFFEQGGGNGSCCTLRIFFSSSTTIVGLADDTFNVLTGGPETGLTFTPVTSSTPLPAALPLFATGIGGLGLLGWRRKRKALKAGPRKIWQRAGLRIAIAAGLSAGLTGIGHASTVHSKAVTTFTSVYNLDLDATGSSIGPVGTVTIVSNTKKDTLTYTFNMFNHKTGMTEVFLDAAGGTAGHDLGPVTNSLGTFTDSFAAKGSKFSITFSGTDVANSTLGNSVLIFGGVNTTKGLFGDAAPVPGAPDTSATPIPGALPLFVSGIGGLGLLGWRRKRKVRAIT